jgi:thiol-disulfide isomerase/thioredoxin
MRNFLFILTLSLLFFQCEEKKKKTLYDEAQSPSEEKSTKDPGTITGTNIGNIAPEINLPDPEGKMISLSSLREKYVLIDFWASWCGPCRRENPNVVKIYKKYKDKGLEIYGVSLDANFDQWTQAIQYDQLSWIHVSELKAWQSSVVPAYHVDGIPATFLLDKDGKIIAKNLRGEELEMKLKEVLE